MLAVCQSTNSGCQKRKLLQKEDAGEEIQTWSRSRSPTQGGADPGAKLSWRRGRAIFGLEMEDIGFGMLSGARGVARDAEYLKEETTFSFKRNFRLREHDIVLFVLIWNIFGQ